MKKIFLLFSAMILSLAINAQSRDQVLSAVTKAKTTSENVKKATSPATWIKLGEAYFNAYIQPKGSAWIGASQTEAKLVMNGMQVKGTEYKTYLNSEYFIEHYDFMDYYYNSAGQLDMIVVTKPVLEGDLLGMSFDAYMKAHELDVKGSKTKDIKAALVKIRDNYVTDAMTAYTLGNLKLASQLFQSSLKATDNPVTNGVDSLIVFYTALTYNMMGDLDNAKIYYKKCKEIGFDQEGSVYSSIAEIEKAQGDIDEAKAILNDGFIKYPNSQAILISLINLYIDTKDDTEKILTLIRSAQKNEPTNASLVYAEGNIYKQLGDYEKAIECYYKAFETDSNYVYGIYSVGNTYFDLAIMAQTKRDALDINDMAGYEKYQKEFEDNLLKAIDPFEKAFAASKDPDISYAIADGLKQIYFRFRDKKPEYQAGYEKYNKYLEEHKVQPAQ